MGKIFLLDKKQENVSLCQNGGRQVTVAEIRSLRRETVIHQPLAVTGTIIEGYGGIDG
jgi:hypothetical protein